MSRRKAANLIKGCAWLFLAAAVLPTFSTSDEASGEVTRLAVGLPWSPWLVYCESWLASDSSQAALPVFGYDTRLELGSWSMAAMFVGLVLLATSRLLRASEKPVARPTSPAALGKVRALGG